MSTIQVFCQYCDDVRREADGKVSLMGVMPGELTVRSSDQAKATLRKLCTFVNVVIDPRYPESTITIQVLWNESILRETAIPASMIEDLKQEAPGEDPDDIIRVVVTFTTALHDFDVSGGGKLQARVKVGEEYFEAPPLHIKHESSPKPPPE